MDRAAFTQLVRDLIEAMGQQLEAARPIPEGLALRTTDGYLYVFVDDTGSGSTEAVARWCAEGNVPADHLVVFALAPLPDPWADELRKEAATTVVGPEFRRLVDELGIDSPLIERDPSVHRPLGAALPSARELDADMIRAQTWQRAGVLPLASRFYERAVKLKPEYLPGWVGLAQVETEMGRWPEADLAWAKVSELDPGSVEAQMGLAQVAGARGDTEREVALYRALTASHPMLTAPHAALFAALVGERAWPQARSEVETLLRIAPSDPRLHWLHAFVVERGGGPSELVRSEQARARELGLTDGEAAGLVRSLAGNPEGPPKLQGGG